MRKSIDIIVDDVRETRTDVKKILGCVQRQDIRITILEEKEKGRSSKIYYLLGGLRHSVSILVGGIILYILTTFITN